MKPKRSVSNKARNIFLCIAFCALPVCLSAQGTVADTLTSDVLTDGALHLSLDSCLKKALRNNVSVKNAELDVQIAEQTKKEAFSMYFPQISAAAGAFHSDKPFIEYGLADIPNAGIRDVLQMIYAQYGQALGLPNSISFLEKGVVAGVSAVQPVYAGGRIVTGNKLAKLGIEAAKYQQQIVKRDIMLQCEEYYWQVYALEEKKATVAAAIELLESLHKDVTQAVDAGLVLKNDLLRVELELNKMQSNKIQLDNGCALAKSALCQYIGEEVPDSLVLDTQMQQDIQDPLSFKLDAQSSADISYEADLLDLSVEAEKLKRRMTLGEALPQIGFGGAYAYNNLMEKDYTNLVGFAIVQLPLSDWWSTGHKLKKHRFEIEKAENTRNDLMQKLALRTTQIYNDLETAYQQVLNAGISVDGARENLKISRDNYEAGLISLSEMLEAHTLYMQAVNQQTDEIIKYRIKLVHYKQLTDVKEEK